MGEDNGVSVNGRDVEALRCRVDELREQVEARDTFLAIAAHELRNPMTPMVGQVQRLLRALSNPATTLADVKRGLTQIDWLMGQYVKRATTLLDVSRITTGKLRLTMHDVDCSELVRQIMRTHEPAAHHAGCVVSLHAPEKMMVRTDPLALEQILDNLLLNAIKYGAGAPIDVTVNEDAAQFSLSVRDRGQGISQEAQSRIFERFERAVLDHQHAGFGVGLWVVVQLVDAMDGSVTVESVPGNGSTFCVRLPREWGK